MKNTIKQIFHSGKFVTGFVIFLAILLTIIIYPFVVAKDPLAMIGNGNFFKPGTLSFDSGHRKFRQNV